MPRADEDLPASLDDLGLGVGLTETVEIMAASPGSFQKKPHYLKVLFRICTFFDHSLS